MKRSIVITEYSDNGDVTGIIELPLNFESGYKAIRLVQSLANLLDFERVQDSSLFGAYWRDKTLSKIIQVY